MQDTSSSMPKQQPPKKIKRILAYSGLGLLLFTVLVLVLTLLVPVIRLQKAEKYYLASEYDQAYELYNDINGYPGYNGNAPVRLYTTLALTELERDNRLYPLKSVLAYAKIPVFFHYDGEQTVRFATAQEYQEFEELGHSFTPISQKEGHTFLEWVYKDYTFDPKNEAQGIHVYLQSTWQPNDYVITLEDTKQVGGGINVYLSENYGDAIPSKIFVPNGESFAYPTPPQRSGYLFKGWYEDADCTEEYKFSGSLTEDITLYANWFPLPEGVIAITEGATSVQLSGTTPKMFAFFAETSTWMYVHTTGIYDTYGILYDSYPNSEWDDSLNSDNDSHDEYGNFGLGYYVYEGGVYYISVRAERESTRGTTTLHFSYDDKPTNTATAHNPITEPLYEYKKGETVQMTATYGKPLPMPQISRYGYAFLGWYNGETALGTNEVTWTKPSNGNLTSRWVAEGHFITFDPAGGQVETSEIFVKPSQSFTLPIPTKKGHAFLGWYTAADAPFADGIWAGEGDITLYAKWSANTYSVTYQDVVERPKTVTVTLEYNLSVLNEKIETFTLLHGETLSYPEIPTRENAIFAGWYIDPACQQERFDFNQEITEDIYLYAKYIDNGSRDNIYAGETTTVALNAGHFTYFAFVPLVSGSYTFSAPYTVSIRGGLYDKQFNPIVENNMMSGGTKFSFTHECVAGKFYYIGIYSNSSTTNLTVSGAKTPTGVATANCPGYIYPYEVQQSYTTTATFGEAFFMPTPERKGFTFLGWYYNGKQVTADNWPIDTDATLIAHWQPMG